MKCSVVIGECDNCKTCTIGLFDVNLKKILKSILCIIEMGRFHYKAVRNYDFAFGTHEHKTSSNYASKSAAINKKADILN